MKLIDFGAGHWAKTGPLVADKFIGTLQFMAPEVIIARGDDFDATDASQVESTVQIEFKKRPFGIRKYKPGPALRAVELRSAQMCHPVRPGPNNKGARIIEVIEQSRYPGLARAFRPSEQPATSGPAVTTNEQNLGKQPGPKQVATYSTGCMMHSLSKTNSPTMTK